MQSELKSLLFSLKPRVSVRSEMAFMGGGTPTRVCLTTTLLRIYKNKEIVEADPENNVEMPIANSEDEVTSILVEKCQVRIV